MRRLTLLLALLPALGFSQVRSWEKLIGPGLTYRMEFDAGAPIVIHALRWSPRAVTYLGRPELGRGTVYSPEAGGAALETVPAMTIRTGAAAGINADYFPWTGDPLGAMVINNELVSIPYETRSVAAWGPNFSSFGPMQFSGKATSTDGKSVVLSGINQEANGNMVVLNTPAAGRAISKQPAVHLVLIMPDKLPPTGTIKATVDAVLTETTSTNIPDERAVLVLGGTSAAAMRTIPRGTVLEIRTQLTGFDAEKATCAVGGGPIVLRNNQIVAKTGNEGFKSDIVVGRHPRSAIGRTADGDIWLVAVEGRQPKVSRGMTLTELGQLMTRLGCVDAMNLDGGGSTTMAVNGIAVNRGSDGALRSVSNGLLLFGESPFQLINDPVDAPTMVIVGKPRFTFGLFSQYQVVDANGVTVPNSEIIWSAEGAAWVDQGGFLRGISTGTATLRAAVRGRILDVKVGVDPAVVPPNKVPPP